MSARFSYPRIPHLVPGRGTADDLVLGAAQRDELLSSELLVEEKLDGANVMVWSEDGILESSGRAGPGSADRAGQFGALRAWVATNQHRLAPLVEDGSVLYGEWLHLTHTVAYHDLPSWFVALDLRRSDGTFVTGAERRDVLGSTDLVLPPLVGRGRFTIDELEHLALESAWSDGPAEGVVLRPLDSTGPASRLHAVKLVRSGFVRIDDQQWRGGRRLNPLRSDAAR